MEKAERKRDGEEYGLVRVAYPYLVLPMLPIHPSCVFLLMCVSLPWTTHQGCDSRMRIWVLTSLSIPRSSMARRWADLSGSAVG